MISASPQPEAKVIALLPVQELNPRSSRSDLAMMAGKPLFFWVLETLLSLPVIGVDDVTAPRRHLCAKVGL
jgi:hypothetical protein